jgi:hypothetical protein
MKIIDEDTFNAVFIKLRDSIEELNDCVEIEEGELNTEEDFYGRLQDLVNDMEEHI